MLTVLPRASPRIVASPTPVAEDIPNVTGWGGLADASIRGELLQPCRCPLCFWRRRRRPMADMPKNTNAIDPGSGTGSVLNSTT